MLIHVAEEKNLRIALTLERNDLTRIKNLNDQTLLIMMIKNLSRLQFFVFLLNEFVITFF